LTLKRIYLKHFYARLRLFL